MEELASELRRLRPGWMRPEPTNSAAQHIRFWENEIWEASRRDLFDRQSPAHLAEEAAVREINQVTQQNRDQWRPKGFNVDSHGLADRISNAHVEIAGTPVARLIGPAAADLQGPIEYWRAETASTLAGLFSMPATEPFSTYRQWLDPFVDLAALDAHRDDFMSLLLTEVHQSAVIRNWLRWAVRFAQTAARVSHGNARDEQLAGYLPDVDILATNDRTFARLLKEVREASPQPVGEVRFVDLENSESVTEAILKAINT